jgi:hypothetical protein
MRTFFFALVTLAVACGDNDHPGIFVETRVASNTLAAGDRVDARCSVVDDKGNPALDVKGHPYDESTDFVVSYEDMSSFATDSDGMIVAAKVGTAAVRCSAPSLALTDKDPEVITIVAGPPVRAITRLDTPTTLAGQPDGVTCLVFDAFDNPVTTFTQTLSLSPQGAGTTTTAMDVTATIAGEYTVACVIMGAADVQPDDLVVLPALPATITGSLDPERTIYSILDRVTLLAESFDQYGNRVDDVNYAYSSSPFVSAPSPARYVFAQDGLYYLTAMVTSQTQNNVPLSVSLPALVDSNGPAISCQRIDAPTVAAEAYMVQQAPGVVSFPVHISSAFQVQTVTIGGNPASLDANGNFSTSVSIGFGMNFVDVVATDTNGVQNSTTCFVLAAQYYTPENTTMAGAVSLRLDQYAIGDPDPTGLDSLNDMFYTVMSSDQLRQMVDTALSNANPINSGGCGIFACNPNVNYNAGSLAWDQPTTTLTLINGGLRAYIYLPNVRLTVRACGTTCCIGGSTIQVTASYISATVDFSLTLSGGKIRTSLAGAPTVTVGSVNLNGSGFCGFVINLIQGFFTGTVKNAVQSSLTNFINNNVAPMLDQITSSLDINTLGTTFNVPRLDGTGYVTLGFGLAFTSFDITTLRALMGIGTRFTPGTVTNSRPSLGIPRRTASALLDPSGTGNADPVGVTAYEGLLNEVLHGLWRGGYFQATLNIGGGTATIDSRLPAVAVITPGNTAQLMLGGVQATLTIPGVIDTPITILFGGRANATVTLNGNKLTFGNLQLQQLYVSFQVTLSQTQRDAMENFLTQALQDTLGSAINNGLPAFPIPSFTLPASVAAYGLPAGAQLGIVNPVLNTSGSWCVLTGGFGAQ